MHNQDFSLFEQAYLYHPHILVLCVVGYLMVPAFFFFAPPIFPRLLKWTHKKDEDEWSYILLWPLVVAICLVGFTGCAVIYPFYWVGKKIVEWRRNRINAYLQAKNKAELELKEDRRKREEFASRHL